MSGAATGSTLGDVVASWAREVGLDPAQLPAGVDLAEALGPDPLRPGVPRARLADWERRHGFRLPRSLRAWLARSDGLFGPAGPLVHPLSAIGPMIPFARMPGLVVQPESWFELGNPPTESVCIDLGYTWPGGDCPVFASGDDQTRSRPRLIAPGFAAWLRDLLRAGGREYWFDPAFVPLGDPWAEHRRHAPPPPLPERLRSLAARAQLLMHPGADDRSIASALGISRGDVEALFRHLQH